MKAAICLALLWSVPGMADGPGVPEDKGKPKAGPTVTAPAPETTLPLTVELPLEMRFQPIPLSTGLVLAPREPGPTRPPIRMATPTPAAARAPPREVAGH